MSQQQHSMQEHAILTVPHLVQFGFEPTHNNAFMIRVRHSGMCVSLIAEASIVTVIQQVGTTPAAQHHLLSPASLPPDIPVPRVGLHRPCTIHLPAE